MVKIFNILDKNGLVRLLISFILILIFTLEMGAQNENGQTFYWENEYILNTRQDLFTRSQASTLLEIPVPGNPVRYNIHPRSFVRIISDEPEANEAIQSFSGRDNLGNPVYGYYLHDQLHLSYYQNGRLFVVSPVEKEVNMYFISSVAPASDGSMECAVLEVPGIKTRAGGNSVSCQNQNYSRWTFDLFVVCTGEWGNFYKKNKTSARKAIMNHVNVLNAFYTGEMNISFNLIMKDEYIYVNSSTDPFDPTGSVSRADQARRFFRDSIDTPFDIGHVMHKRSSTGNSASGIAYVRGLCNGDYKGGGWTGTSDPTDVNFTFNVFGHEIGHQLGADHSFYGSAGNCGDNRSERNGFEPGSGSSFMSYYGQCGSHNLDGPPTKYFYFNTHSYNQILQFINAQNCGNRMGSSSNLSVQIPGDFSIPLNTAFDLTATSSGSYRFIWEQYDTDNSSSHSSPLDGGKYASTPMYRSYDFSNSGNHRSFPSKEVQRTSPNRGEVYATIARDITLRLTTRSGGNIRCDEMTVTVRNDPALRIQQPSQGEVVDIAESPTRATSEFMTVIWETGDTENNGFPTIDILYSTDGGGTYPHLLADDVPNDGEQAVRPPEIETDQARLKILLSDGSDRMAVYHENRGNFSVLFSPLPIEISDFTGRNQDNAHVLSWKLNNTGEYVRSVNLEYSYDGIFFHSVLLDGFEVLNSESSWTGNYVSHYNQDPKTYYRLVIEDVTEHKTYSAVISLKNEVNYEQFLTISPNPARHEVRLIFESYLRPQARITLWSINGRKMYKIKAALRTRSMTLPLNYPNGLYIVEVNNGGDVYREKVLISR